MTDFLVRYSNDIEGFIREVLKFPNEEEKKKGWDIYPWQLKVLKAYERGERRISIRSGHGVGKTTLLVWLAIFSIIFRHPQRTAVTAPTEKQLFNAFWADFKVWHSRLPPVLRTLVVVKGDRAEHSNEPGANYTSIATARKEQPEALQGVHSPGHVILIADEASGVPGEVFEAASGSMSGHNCVTVLAGNPVRGSGFFYDTHTRLSDLWFTLRVSCFDVPQTVSKDFITQIERTYGINSNAYRVRVLGEFPVKDDDTIIPFDLVESSYDRDVQISKTAPVIWGVDPARFGSDRSTLAKRQTRQLLEPIRWWEKLDTMELASRVKNEWDISPPWLRPSVICVDSIGIGAGVVDRLKELGLPVRGVNVSETPATINAEKYANLRTELWFAGAEWFAARDCKLPDYYRKPERTTEGDDLARELTLVRYKFRPGSGKIVAESKDDMKKRGLRSPDLADAFLLTFAVDASTLIHGSKQTNWRTKISRQLKGVV
jgi:phage terminase large subunit